MNKKTTVGIGLFVLVLGFMFVILGFSSQGAEQSEALSTSLTKSVLECFNSYNKLDATKQAQVVGTVQEVLRSLAHFVLFFLLGVSVTALLLYVGPKDALKRAWLICMGVCVIMAIVDETYQSIQGLGRAFEMVDLCKDWLGSAYGIGLYMWIIKKSSQSEDSSVV